MNPDRRISTLNAILSAVESRGNALRKAEEEYSGKLRELLNSLMSEQAPKIPVTDELVGSP